MPVSFLHSKSLIMTAILRTAPLRFHVVCGLLFALLLSGCGQAGPEKAIVKGKATFDNVPIEKGSIAFIPTGSNQGPSSGAIIEKGEYRTPDGNGPVLGPHRIEVTAHRAGKTVTVPGAAGATSGPSGGGTVETIEMYIPEKYNKKSELTLDVKSGENVMDLNLTSK